MRSFLWVWAEGICGQLHVTVRHQMFEVCEQHHVCELVANVFGWMAPASEFFSLVPLVQFNWDFLPEVKMHKLGHIQSLSHLRNKRDLPFQIGKMMEKHKGEDGTKWPCTCWTPNTIHCVVNGSLDILNLGFGLVLVLAVRLAMSLINTEHLLCAHTTPTWRCHS